MAEPGEYCKVPIKQFPARSIQETPEGKYWRRFRAPQLSQQIGAVTHIDFCSVPPHEFVVTSSTRLIVFDSKTGHVKRTFSRFRDIAYGGSFRPDGQLLVAGGAEGVVRVFDSKSRTVLRQLKGHQGPVHLTRYGPDKLHVLSGGDDNTVRWWDVPSQDRLLQLEGHSDYVRCGAVSPTDGELWATGSYDHTVKLWDMRSGKCAMTLQHGKPVEDLTFFPSGGLLASAGGNYLQVWDILSGGRCLRRMSNHQKTITAVKMASVMDAAFLDGGTAPRLISAGIDGHVKIYDVNEFKVTHGSKYPAPILCLGLSSTSNCLAVGMANGLLAVRIRRRSKVPLLGAMRDEGVEETGGEGGSAGAGRRRRPPKPGTFRYFMRGQSTRAAPGDAVLAHRHRAHVAAHDKYLRRFKYGEALDAALRTGRAEVVVSVMEELVARRGLKVALQGRDSSSLEPLLAFLVKHVASPRYSELLTQVAHKVLDLYGGVFGLSSAVDRQVLLLRERVLVEVRLQEALQGLLGLMQPILTSSFRYAS